MDGGKLVGATEERGAFLHHPVEAEHRGEAVRVSSGPQTGGEGATDVGSQGRPLHREAPACAGSGQSGEVAGHSWGARDWKRTWLSGQFKGGGVGRGPTSLHAPGGQRTATRCVTQGNPLTQGGLGCDTHEASRGESCYHTLRSLPQVVHL